MSLGFVLSSPEFPERERLMLGRRTGEDKRLLALRETDRMREGDDD